VRGDVIHFDFVIDISTVKFVILELTKLTMSSGPPPKWLKQMCMSFKSGK